MSPSELFVLTGKRAVVTGASRGIGQAMALGLARAGADVACVSTLRGNSNQTAAAIRAMGRIAWQFEANLADRRQTGPLPDLIEEEAGAIDILVNNAGTIRRQPTADDTLEDWHAVIRANLDSAFLLCEGFGKRMILRGSGKIINIASLMPFSSGLSLSAYNTCRNAVAGITKALANELGPYGVQVNAIAPGYFRTTNTHAQQDDAARGAEITARIPAGRCGEPEDMAGPVVFFASNASDYVNGHVLTVDGGWMAG